MPSPKKTRTTKLRPQVKLWLQLDGEHVFCSGLWQILQAVERTGSIKDAAAQIEKSYRFVWDKIKRAERKLGQKLVDAHVGGAGVRRSTLTPLGAKLVVQFAELRKQLHAVVDATDWSAQLPQVGR